VFSELLDGLSLEADILVEISVSLIATIWVKDTSECLQEIQMNPLKLKRKEEWNELLRLIAEETEMTVSLTDGKGNRLLQSQGERCPLCAKIREKEDSLTFICSQCNTAMLREARQVSMPIIDCCDAGISRMVVPIIREGMLIGQVTACGGILEDEEIDLFLIARQLGITEEEVEALAASSPIISKDEVRRKAYKFFTELNS